MLNKRWEQEHSQYSTAQRRQQESNSQVIRNIPIEDLRCAIAAMEEHDEELKTEAIRSSFCREIREVMLPEGFKLPTIKAYKWKSDPQDHLDHFNDLIELHLVSDMAKCMVFAVTLTSGAKKWLKSMTPRSITNWQHSKLPSSSSYHLHIWAMSSKRRAKAWGLIPFHNGVGPCEMGTRCWYSGSSH